MGAKQCVLLSVREGSNVIHHVFDKTGKYHGDIIVPDSGVHTKRERYAQLMKARFTVSCVEGFDV
jgi:hypothetical protein